jgi:uncharacterized membrane protein YfcA
MDIRNVLLVALGVITAVYVVVWVAEIRKRGGFVWPKPIELAIGFVTDFFDTLGIGSFAPTISLFKFFRLVPDERVPGTLNVGHALPTVVEAVFFIAIIAVSPLTLISLIVASIAGAWLGAGLVARWPRRYVQIGMGGALLAAAVLFVMKNLNWLPGGGTALGLSGVNLAIAIVAYVCLGALMTLGIGLYAPAMITVSLLGMNPITAFPIMMGSCAFLMPPASIRFIRFDAYSLRAALGLTIGGIPAVIIAAKIVKSLPLTYVRWLVVVVVIYAAITMLRSALKERGQAAAESDYSVGSTPTV